MRLLGTAGIFVIACGFAFGQAAKLEYEVASVKPSPPMGNGPMFMGGRGGPGTQDPGRVTLNNMTVKSLLMQAYDVKQYQVTGPAWIDSERYDIAATVPEGASKEDARVMMQNLLAERFKITLHHETKEFPLYEMTVAKGGPKMKVSTGDYNAPPPALTAPPPPPPGGGRGPIPMGKDGMPELPKGGRGMFIAMMNGRGRLQGNVQKTSDLASMLSNQLGTPVVDKTGLTGIYDFTIDFTPEQGRGMFGGGLPPPPPPPPGAGAPAPPEGQSEFPPLTAAVQEQLGLKLDKTKGPLDMIVVDKGDKVPTDN
jgi:uncharacterized protein (TIGR03435 family)